MRNGSTDSGEGKTLHFTKQDGKVFQIDGHEIPRGT